MIGFFTLPCVCLILLQIVHPTLWTFFFFYLLLIAVHFSFHTVLFCWEMAVTTVCVAPDLDEMQLVPQMVKRLPAMQETWVLSPGWEDPLEKEMATDSGTLAWKIPWMEEPGGLQFMGSQRVRHDWATSGNPGAHIVTLITHKPSPRNLGFTLVLTICDGPKIFASGCF